MNTTAPRSSIRANRPRSRFGYDQRWWGSSARIGSETGASYWETTRRPVPSLAFLLPILGGYELGVAWLGGASADALRTGADAWMRHALSAVRLTDRWFPPLALIVAILGWQAIERESWRFRPRILLGMALESLVFALVLIGLSRLLDFGFDRFESRALLSTHPAASLVGFLGAGVYEEALFRLALIPVIYGCCRLLHAPQLAASVVAITGSALLFSLAHHAGAPGEAFTWFAFVFRWLAGIYFAWAFVVRGFGIAVGTHAAYDILVGWAGMHF